MLPGNPNLYTVTRDNKYIRGQFIFPDNVVSDSELVDWELGGFAVQDPSAGLEYQKWQGYWNSPDSTVYLLPENSTVPLALFTKTAVVEFAFTFDTNMRWSTACRDSSNTLYHKWYDPVTENYTESVYSNIQSVRLCLDDKRTESVQAGTPDMILTYVRANQVHWRIQRDRFNTEYTYPDLAVPPSYRITHFGMNTKNRLQWRIGPRRI